jgi:hypothetical protein
LSATISTAAAGAFVASGRIGGLAAVIGCALGLFGIHVVVFGIGRVWGPRLLAAAPIRWCVGRRATERALQDVDHGAFKTGLDLVSGGTRLRAAALGARRSRVWRSATVMTAMSVARAGAGVATSAVVAWLLLRLTPLAPNSAGLVVVTLAIVGIGSRAMRTTSSSRS